MVALAAPFHRVGAAVEQERLALPLHRPHASRWRWSGMESERESGPEFLPDRWVWVGGCHGGRQYVPCLGATTGWRRPGSDGASLRCSRAGAGAGCVWVPLPEWYLILYSLRVVNEAEAAKRRGHPCPRRRAVAWRRRGAPASAWSPVLRRRVLRLRPLDGPHTRPAHGTWAVAARSNRRGRLRKKERAKVHLIFNVC